MALNQRVLAALVDYDGCDVARIVHHAAQAGDVDAIVRYGPAAARDAARAGAHREAVAHLGLVLEHEDRFTAGERAELLAQYAIECYTIGAIDKAVEAERRAVDLNRSLGDLRQLGASLRWLARMSWMAGDRSERRAGGREAVDVLEQAGDSRLLALALSNESQLCMLAHRPAESIAYGERAAALAREVGDAAIISHALTNIGTSQWHLGDPAGQPTLDEALRVALEAGEVEDACRAYVNLAWNLLDWYRLDEAERYLTVGHEAGRGLRDLQLPHLHAGRACAAGVRAGLVGRGRPHRRASHGRVLAARCPALTVLGRVRVRRGQPGAPRCFRGVAADGKARGAAADGPGRGRAARRQPGLRGDQAGVRDIAAPVYQEAKRLGDRVHQAELGYWLAKAGQQVQPDGDHPYAVQAAGRWREAAAAWEAAGCPYEHAAALAESPDPEQLLTALAMLDELGAKPLATEVRRRLRALGVTRIPRGPRAKPGSTRWPDRPPDRRAAPARQGLHERSDRQPAGGFRAHGRQSRRGSTRQARRGQPTRGRCPRGRAGVLDAENR